MENALLQDINDLPIHIYQADNETIIKPCAEVFLTQKAAEKILEEGLMPLLSFRDSDHMRLARFQSIALPSTPLNGKWTSLEVSWFLAAHINLYIVYQSSANYGERIEDAYQSLRSVQGIILLISNLSYN